MVDNPRLVAPVTHGNAAEHRRLIAMRANAGLPKDGSERAQAPVPLQIVGFAQLPDAALWEGSLIFVPDDIGGPVPAFSDGTNWLRVTDRAVVSDV